MNDNNKQNFIKEYIAIKSNIPLKDNVIDSLQTKLDKIKQIKDNNISHLFGKKYLIALVASIILALGLGFALGEFAVNKEKENGISFACGKYIGVEHYFYGIKKH